MNAAKQAVWLFSILLLLACSGWYFASTSTTTYKLDDKTLSVTTDTIIKELHVRQFNEQGQLANRLETPLLEHVPLNDTHLLDHPRIMITQENQSPWKIQSEQAVAVNGGEEITFIKNVLVHQNKGENNQESTLRTEKITYYPKTKKATTSLAVVFEQPGTVVKATGMNVYLDEKRVELLSRARGSYVPSHG